MKSNLIGRTLFGVMALAAPFLTGFRPPGLPPLENTDRRPAAPAVAAAGAAADAPAAVPAGLRKEAAVDGRGRFVRAERGFLTGPDGAGGFAAPAAAAAFRADDADRSLKAFLDTHREWLGHGPEPLAAARRIRENVAPRSGLRSVVFQQQVDGLPVVEAVLVAHTTRAGELVNVYSSFLSDPEGAAPPALRAALVPGPAVSAEQALAAAAAEIGVVLPPAAANPAGALQAGPERMRFYTAPGLSGRARASLAWLPVENGLRLCWDVILSSRARGEMFRVLVDAGTGEAWLRRSLTEYLTPASYRVFTGDSPSPMTPGLSTPSSFQPPEVARALVTWSALSTNASPQGWIPDGDNTTLGNNADSHLDRDGDDVPDSGSRPAGSPARVFDFACDLTQAPTAYTKASVVQLFYLNNIMHDWLYDLGFTESAGNFQADNFGRGGLGGDAVQADAQDGSGTDNANMSTPPDGMEPRMQMFVFTGPTPDRDGDFDCEVVLHEYTHGLSNRRVGGGVGIYSLQSRGMGEGWSDFYPLCLLSDPSDDPSGTYPCGAYVSYMLGGLTQNYYYGIRRYPYSTDMAKNPLTFKDIDPAQASDHPAVPMSPIGGGSASEVHNMGEVWCAALWDARASLIGRHGAAEGNRLILQLVTDGMALSPPNPNFLQGRDAIIQADLVLTGGQNYTNLWAAFARRGMGYGARSPDAGAVSGLVEAYNMPDDLVLAPDTGWASEGYQYGPFTPSNATYLLRNMGRATVSWTASSSAGWIAFSASSGSLAPNTTTSVVVSLGAQAYTLTPGTRTATVTFRNTGSGIQQQIPVELTVREIPGVVSVEDSIEPENDLALPFGGVAPGFLRSETIRVRNASPQYDLVVSGVGFGFYEEDFNDGLAQSWTPTLGLQWSVTNGEYKAWAKAIDRLMQSAYTGETWSDGRFRVTMRRTGDRYSAAVLALRASPDFNWNNGSGSAYMIGHCQGYYYVGKYVNGRFSMLQNWSVTPYTVAATNYVEGTLKGDLLTVSFNGHTVYSKADSSLPGPGRMALLAYSGDYVQTIHYFDDVTVDQPAATPLVGIAQQWYNARASDSEDPLKAPADWTVPVFPGVDPEKDSPPASWGPMLNGPFRLDNLPDFPVRLAPGASLSFTAAYQPAALGATNRNTVLVRSADAVTPELSVELTGWGATNRMAVLPAAWLELGGRPGGPFPNAWGVYTVSNGSPDQLEWRVTGLPAWLDASPSGGDIPAFGAVACTVTVTEAAAALPPGVYSNALAFHNAAVHGPPSRGVVLTIRESPVLTLQPAVLSLTNRPDGVVPVPLTIGNTGQSNLFWSLRLPGDELDDDVESGEGGWTHSGFNDRWHVSALRSASGAQAWYSGTESNRTYPNNANASLVSAPLLLGAYAKLRFNHWYVTESGFDYGYVEISTNNGTSYAGLLTVSGSNGTWLAQAIDLSAYAGRMARIRFRFRSDNLNVGGVGYEGWYVDDIRVAPLAVGPENRVTADAVSGMVEPGGSTAVAVSFNAAGLAEGASLTGSLAVACNDVDRPFVPVPWRMDILAPLTVTLPSRAREGDGPLPGAGRVIVPVAPEADTPIRLVSSDPVKVAVPASVVLPAGQTGVVFDVEIGDDGRLEGALAVRVSAFTDRFGYAAITVDDNEGTNLVLALPAGAYEGRTLTNAGRVSISGTLGRSLEVRLESSDTGEWVVPAAAIIPPGATSALFSVTVPADGLPDGVQTGAVRATAAGFAPASAIFQARDADVCRLDFSALTGSRMAGTPFAVTLSACDTNGEPVLIHQGAAALTASGKGGSQPVLPASVALSNGVWAGTVTLRKPDTTVRLAAASGNLSGLSRPFNVVIGPLDHFTWANVVSPQNVGYAFKATVTARDAAENTVTGFTGTATITGFTGWEGAPDYRKVNVAPAAAVRFARGVWSGQVTVQQAAQEMCLKAQDAGGRRGYSARFNAGPLSLFLNLPAAVREHDGAMPKAGTVTLSRAVATNVAVKLVSADKAELKVPAFVTVPAGKLSAAFTLTPVDDAVLDTAKVVRVSATLAGYAPASGYVEVRPAFVKTPVMSPPGGVFAGSRVVALGCPTAGAVLRYTDDGSEVGEEDDPAPAQLTVTEDCVLRVKGFKAGSLPSETVTGVFRKAPLAVLPNPAAEADLEADPEGLLARRIDVPEFATNLTVAISGGWGDCDLLLRHGELPDTNAYDYYPALPGNEESVSVPNPAQGPWYALLQAGPAGFGGVTLTSAWQVDIPPVDAPFITPAGGIKIGSVNVAMTCATTGAVIRYTLNGTEPGPASTAYAAPVKIGPTPLTRVTAKAFKAGRPDSPAVAAEYQVAKAQVSAGVVLTIAGGLESQTYYAFKCPAGAKSITITLIGGTGNANLYVSRSVFPTLAAFQAGSVIPGNSELLQIQSPVAGSWYYLLVHGKAAYSSAKLKVTVP